MLLLTLDGMYVHFIILLCSTCIILVTCSVKLPPDRFPLHLFWINTKTK